jgi:hypothetical protein
MAGHHHHHYCEQVEEAEVGGLVAGKGEKRCTEVLWEET